MVEEGSASQNTRDRKKSRRQLVRRKAQREKNKLKEIIFTSSGEIDKFSRALKCKVPTAEAGSQHLTIQVMDLIRIEAELSQRSW